MGRPERQVASEQVPKQDGFRPAHFKSKWYLNLERSGSCKRLLELLTEDLTLIHMLGYDDMTVLHKGVRHGYVALVRFILVDMFDDHGHCKCRRHDPVDAPTLTREQLLRKTCSYGSTAVNMAVVSGSPKMVVLLEWAIKMCERLRKPPTEDNTFSTASWVRTSLPFRDASIIRSSYMEGRGKEITQKEVRGGAQIQFESTGDTDEDFLVPDVKDDDLSILYSRNSEVESKVISVIEGVLEDPGDKHREWMDMVKEWVAKDVDFEFVPLAHVFLHFLSSVRCYSFEEGGFNLFREEVTKRIFEACGDNGEDGESGAMLRTLFNILDPRGRPFLHVAYEFYDEKFGPKEGNNPFFRMLDQLGDISLSIKKMFWNVCNGAGGTIFHLMGIHNKILDMPFGFEVGPNNGNMTGNSRAPLSHNDKLDALKKWCFPRHRGGFRRLTPTELALLLNSRKFLAKNWPSDGSRGRTTDIDQIWSSDGSRGQTTDIDQIWPSDGSRGQTTDIDENRNATFQYSIKSLQLAAALGRAVTIDFMLKHHKKFDTLKDPGLQDQKVKDQKVKDQKVEHLRGVVPAIHYAAAFGQVEAIQNILKFPVYDPMVQDIQCGTALHALLDKQHVIGYMKNYHDCLLCHILPYTKGYIHVKEELFDSHLQQDVSPRMYSSNEMSCINLLLQAGIDIWTPHVQTKKLPSPGFMANDDARKWWFDKVVEEVVVLKTSVSYAANATSVVGALVATASFIGPFQPPLGYGDVDGFVRTDWSPLRVYLVCNSLSFYFSIASILMSLLPAIPMPKESLYDELLRSQRCLKGAALMLLISIICILISFSSASIGVVSPQWHERRIVVSCVIFGGAICVAVLVIYIIRLLRMLFHRNNRVRRMFAKYMYF